MRRVLALLIVLAASGTALWLSAPPAAACSCVAPEPGTTDEELVAEHDAVFTGTAFDSRDDDTRWVFDVYDVEKGAVDSPQDIYTPPDEASCAYPFRVGGTYRVFATESDGRLNVNLCGPTEELSSGPATPVEPVRPVAPEFPEFPEFPEVPEPVPFEPPQPTPIPPPPEFDDEVTLSRGGGNDEGTSAGAWVIAAILAAAAAGGGWFARQRLLSG